MNRNEIMQLRNYQPNVENEKSDFRLQCEAIGEIILDEIRKPLFLTMVAGIYLFSQFAHYNMQTNILQNLENKQGIEKTVNDIRNTSHSESVSYLRKLGYGYAVEAYLENNKEHWE